MKTIFFILQLLLISCFLSAQTNYKFVFDVTGQDTLDHKLTIRWANEFLKTEPTAKVEVVFLNDL